MNMTYRIPTLAAAALLSLLAGCLCAGCGDGKDRRATVAYHTEGCRLTLAGLRKVIGSSRKQTEDPEHGLRRANYFDMVQAVDRFQAALSGLPKRVQERSTDRTDERKAAAEKAIELFDPLGEQLKTMKFDKDEASATLDQIAGLLDVVDAS